MKTLTRGPCDGRKYESWTTGKDYVFHSVEWVHTWGDGVTTREHAWETVDDKGKTRRISDTALRNPHHWIGA
jgi:hypothetical protein